MPKTYNIKVFNPSGLPVVDYRMLKDLQPESFKTLSKANEKKLIESFEINGFFIPMFVWIKDENFWTIDGHQRLRTLKKVAPGGLKIPYVIIEADNITEAAKKLLAVDSKFGKRTGAGELDFVNAFQIEEDYLKNAVTFDFAALQKSIEEGISTQFEAQGGTMDDQQSNEQPPEKKKRLILEYSEEELHDVKAKLKKHGKTPEEAVWNLLNGMDSIAAFDPGEIIFE